MTEDMIALARRAVACKGWRWREGMRTTCGVRVNEGGNDYLIGHRQGATRDGGGWIDDDSAGYLPDLTDPATLGCLLALVREAWGDPLLNVLYLPTEERWGVERWYDGVRRNGACTSEAESLVAALEAAP